MNLTSSLALYTDDSRASLSIIIKYMGFSTEFYLSLDDPNILRKFIDVVRTEGKDPIIQNGVSWEGGELTFDHGMLEIFIERDEKTYHHQQSTIVPLSEEQRLKLLEELENYARD